LDAAVDVATGLAQRAGGLLAEDPALCAAVIDWLSLGRS
jgi:hypothetical protein